MHYGYLGNGLVFWEKGDKNYKGQIHYDRKVTFRGTFTPENENKIHKMAAEFNTAVGNEGTEIALCPLNAPTLGYTNKVTGELYKLSIELVDNKEQLVFRRTILNVKRENCTPL